MIDKKIGADISITVDELGFGKVILNGIDVTKGVCRIDIHSTPMDIPEVTLTYYATALTFNGIAKVITETEGE